MTIEEIFIEITNHMIKGLMVHTKMAEYYDFLNLQGYRACHEYHSLAESISYRKINHYYMEQYHKLIPETRFDVPEIIPTNWYKYTRQDVDQKTRRNAVKTGMETWLSWEQDTKKLYEEMFKELYDTGNVAASLKVKDLIQDVEKEIATIENKMMKMQAVDFNIQNIVDEQDAVYTKFKSKMYCCFTEE